MERGHLGGTARVPGDCGVGDQVEAGRPPGSPAPLRIEATDQALMGPGTGSVAACTALALGKLARHAIRKRAHAHHADRQRRDRERQRETARVTHHSPTSRPQGMMCVSPAAGITETPYGHPVSRMAKCPTRRLCPLRPAGPLPPPRDTRVHGRALRQRRFRSLAQGPDAVSGTGDRGQAHVLAQASTWLGRLVQISAVSDERQHASS